MNNQFERKLKTRAIILKQRILKPKFFLKIIIVLSLVVVVVPSLVYLIVYNGYSEKTINSTDQISDELTTGVLISDSNSKNLNYLTDQAQDAFEKREINYLYIFLVGDSQSLKDDDIQKLLPDIPSSSMKIDRESEDFFDVCNRAQNIYDLNKFVVLGFKDTAIQSTFICNNLGMYVQGFSPAIDESSIGITPLGILNYIKVITRVYFGIKL